MGTRRAILGLLVGAAGLLLGLQHAKAQPPFLIPNTTNVAPGQTVQVIKAGVVITGTGDVATVPVPGWMTKYRITGFALYNCTVAPTGSPVAGLWTGAGGTGTQVGALSSANFTGATGPTVVSPGTAPASANTLTTTTPLFFNVSAAATTGGPCSLEIAFVDLTGG